MNVYSVFYELLLVLVPDNPMERQVISTLPQVIIDGEVEYEVNKIFKSQMYQWRLKYLVKWKRYEHLDWIDTQDINQLEAVDCFHALYPGCPGSLPENN